MDILIFAVAFAVAFIALWIIFINVMWAKYNREKIPKILHKPIEVLAFFGLLYDILFNLTFGNFLFLQAFSLKRLTLTERMKHILITNDGWRFNLAYFI